MSFISSALTAKLFNVSHALSSISHSSTFNRTSKVTNKILYSVKLYAKNANKMIQKSSVKIVNNISVKNVLSEFITREKEQNISC